MTIAQLRMAHIKRNFYRTIGRRKTYLEFLKSMGIES